MSNPGFQHKQPRNIDLPVYPKAFIAAARLTRERDRVFVAMPFGARHTEALWRVIRGLCDIHGLNVVRGDSAVRPNPIVADILEELERAEIIVADLTGLNPNVLYEVGIAHARCDSVILLSQKEQSLPFDLANIRCISYDLSTREGQIELAERLGRTLEALKTVGPPMVIESTIERTNFIVNDLKALANLCDEELSKETVWFSGFLSAFAIGEEGEEIEDKYYRALIDERKALLSLALRGCRIRCIITPVSQTALIPARLDVARRRTSNLITFLESNRAELRNIEWAVSDHMQKNLYIIGRISCFEGFKKGIQRGFSLTLRQTQLGAIDANVSLYEILFDRLATKTVATYSGQVTDDRREALRLATIDCLQESLRYCATRMQGA